jgi:ATP adenylyltransferase
VTWTYLDFLVVGSHLSDRSRYGYANMMVANLPDERFSQEASFGRFAVLLSKNSHGRQLYDEPLFEVDDCVIAPTLGSVVPRWLLIVPRVQAPNFVRWRAETGVEPCELIGKVAAYWGVEDKRVIWFEHGAAGRGSPVACGVDHAHLHVIIDAPFSFDEFASSASASATALHWRQYHDFQEYPSIEDGASYLLAASGKRAVLAERVDEVGSQFFRRVVARLARIPGAWDYRSHSHIEKVRETVRAFRRRAARSAVR